MSLDKLWSWYPYPDLPLPIPRRMLMPAAEPYSPLPGSTFFLFIEEAEQVRNARAMDDPAGSPLATPHPVFATKPVRFRGSGVDAFDFIEQMAKFVDLGEGAISSTQRMDRRTALRAYFEQSPVHHFDLYISGHDKEGRAIRATFVPARWQMISLGTGGEAQQRPVIHGPAAAGGPYRVDWLRWILPVPPPIELRLRDIFSLNHVDDADLGTPEGGGPGGAPPPDDRPRRSASPAVQSPTSA